MVEDTASEEIPGIEPVSKAVVVQAEVVDEEVDAWREEAVMRWPQREGESDEAFIERIEKTVPLMPTMWGPGRSGNPAGRKKRVSSVKEALEAVMGERLQLRWKDGDVEGIARVTRRDVFFRHLGDLLAYGEIEFPDRENRIRKGEARTRKVQLGALDWANYALKFMRYIAPPAPAEKTSEITQVVFDIGSMMPVKVKRKIIKQKTGTDPVIYDELPVEEGPADGNQSQ